jgi:hypothetical protein
MAKRRRLSLHVSLLAILIASGATPARAQILSADRLTTWNPGIPGGIPVRNTICATVDAATYGNGANEASGGIQAALDACPVGQVVQLSAGTFKINTAHLAIKKGITLRGMGPGLTTLQKTNGAVPGSSSAGDARPVVVIGPQRWTSVDETTMRLLTADAVKGAFSVTVASATGYAAGQFVILDEDNYTAPFGFWAPLPDRNNAPTAVTIWKSDRVVWQKHNPPDGPDDPFPEALGWFSRPARPVNEIKEIASVAGNTITFTTPIHITYRVSRAAQVVRYTGSNVQVKNAGLENLKVYGGGDGAVRFESAAYSWVKNIENTVWLGEGVAINDSFKCVLRDSYIHDAAWPAPGGGGYAISLGDASAEILIENNIIMKANKMMVARSSGAASVVGYNYADDGYIFYVLDWQEVGINGSHMVGPHHMLFEGNQSFNYDSDNTHGSAIYHTAFRNHLTGFRRSFPGLSNGRTIGLGYGSYWHSFVGNVLGLSGQMGAWVYQDPGDGSLGNAWGDQPAIWELGYDPIYWQQKADPQVVSTTVRQGNFDYKTNTVNWDTSPQTLPNSLYLASKPPFFYNNPWPWVNPTGTPKLYTLPARSRYDAATPNVIDYDVIFADGFESAGIGSWSVSNIDAGNLNVDASAAMKGTPVGLRAVVNDTHGLWVQDDNPNNEDRVRARFYFDPNGFDPGEAQAHLRTRLLIVYEDTPIRRLAAVVLRRMSGQYAVMGRVQLDDDSHIDTGFVPITDAPHYIEIDWRRASGPSANDGSFQLYLDGNPVGTNLTGLDNNLSSADFVRMGALSVKTGAGGTLLFDEYFSRRANYVGP